MNKKMRILGVFGIVITMVFCISGCSNNTNSDAVDNSIGLVNTEDIEVDNKDDSVTETAEPSIENNPTSETLQPNSQAAVIDLKPSDGLEFESNGDGTCKIVGIGTCTDKDLVIPEKSPAGDTVTLIDEYAFYSLEDVESVTLVNANYEVDKNAFQYGEFATLNIIGGSPAFKKSAFSSCEDLTSISFCDCNIQADEYAFYSCGKDADISFSNCTGYIDERAFQYGDFKSLTISNCELEIDESAFSSCEDLTSIIFTDSIIKADEYAFYSCGDSANVEMINCAITLDERVFQYSSLASLTITGSEVEMGKSAFSSCEDLTTIQIDCSTVTLDEYAFYSCEDLIRVSICENSELDNNISIDDRAFQYCKRLESVTIGNGSVAIGEYVFSGCADNLTISIAGKNYTADSIKDGLK